MHTINKKIREVLSSIIVAIATGFFIYYPITDGDLFWHIAAGKEILAGFHWLYNDPFAYSIPNAKWIDCHWLFQIFAFSAHQIAGFEGLIVISSIVFGVTCALLFNCIKVDKGRWIFVGLFCLTIYEIRYLIPLRPLVFTLLYSTLFIYLLEKFIKSGNRKFLFLLIPVQILWVNTQGLFFIGLAIFISYAIGYVLPILINAIKYKRISVPATYDLMVVKKTLLSFAIIAPVLLISTLINPYGTKVLGLSLEIFERIEPTLHNIYSVNIPENTPILKLLGTDSSHHFYITLVLCLLAFVSSIFAWRKSSVPLILTCIVLLPLSMMAQRNIPIFAFAALPLITRNISVLTNTFKSKRSSILITVFSLLICIPVIAGVVKHGSMLLHYKTGPIAPFSFPEGSAEYLKRYPIEGNLFNADRHGGYLLWTLFPSRQVYIDTRLVIRPRSFFASYLDILDNPERFSIISEQYKITIVCLPLALVDRYFPLAKKLYNDSSWKCVYVNSAEVLFVRSNVCPTAAVRLENRIVLDSITNGIKQKWALFPSISDEAVYSFGSFLSSIGLCNSADRVLTESQSSTVRIARALNFAHCGGIDSAIDELMKIVKTDPSNSGARIALARMYLQKDNFQKALENVILVLRRDPFDVRARALIRAIHSSQS